MIDQQERYYNILKLNRWFALSSLLFAGIFVLAFVDDYQRPWKKFQKEFRSVEIEKINKNLAELNSTLESNHDYKEILNLLSKADEKLQDKVEEIDDLNAKIKDIDAVRYGVNQNHQFAKAEYDVAKYKADQARHGLGDLVSAEKNLKELDELTTGFKLELEEVEKKLENLEDQLAKLYSEQKTYNDELNSISHKRDLTARKLLKTDPEKMSFSNKIANVVRDLPVLDFIDPYYEVKQVVVKDIEEDLIYMGMPKVDRCMTCHMGIDKKGFENAPQPYSTHPNLDQMVGPNSPHPMSEFGCTTCHAGRGRGTGFNSTAHSPSSPDQAHEWEENYDWHPMHHWDNPMFTKQNMEAGCFKCHSGNMPIAGAETLSLGMAIVERAGCFGCHQLDRWEGKPKTGPNLAKIASKTTNDWTWKWINSPRDFRHNTWMPHFFNITNNNDAKSVQRTKQEIHSITEYLFSNSESYSMDKLPRNANAENGRLLVASLGCMGCHEIQPEAEADDITSIQSLRQEQGPNLIGLGSKSNAKWIYNWVKNPASFHADTKMPNLRLSNQEAADISVYLIQDVNKSFDAQEIPDVNEEIIDEIAADFLSQQLRKSQVDIKLAEMSIHEKLDFNGQRLIGQYGCFGCHNIPGFDKAKPIGTSLTIEGSKLITKLDFGFQHDNLPHTRWDWFGQKLADPRIFDMIPQEDGSLISMEKQPLDKLRMPDFGLTQHEIDALTTVIMGSVKDEIPVNKLPKMNTKQMAIEAGEQIIQSNNCKGCHKIDGDGGVIWASTADWLREISDDINAEDMSIVQSFSPPLLDSQGRKTQPEWLLNWFKNISMIRPQLQVRMPSFDFSDEEWNTIIEYFQQKDGQSLTYELPHSMSKNSESYKAGTVIQELGACTNCHFYGSQKPKQAALTWAPNLVLSKDRLRPAWLLEFFSNPQNIMPGTKMPAPYIPTEEPFADVLANWGKSVAGMDSDSTRLYQGLIDYIWGLKGRNDVSSIVRSHLENEGYGFIIEDDDEWGGDDW
jgi:cytochrome c2